MKLLGITALLIIFTLFISLHSYDYDLIIIGGGAAGTKAAVLAHDLGKKVLIVEKSSKIGGGRLWHGDIPFKTLYAFSNKIMSVHELEVEGLVSNSFIHIGQGQILSRVSAICEKVYELIKEKNFTHRNIAIEYGSPYFLNKHLISVNQKTISAEKFLIATGSRSYIPPIEGIELVPYLTRENFFDLENVPHFPKSIIIIGGGPLGIELAKVLNQCRVKVTLLTKHAVLLPTYDYEIIEKITSQMIEEGINLVYNVEPIKIEKIDNTFKVEVRNKVGKTKSYEATTLYIACGSQPNSEQLDLENAGVAVNKNGKINTSVRETPHNAILVNEKMQTTASNIYACGDVTGIQSLSRVAYSQANIAIKNMFAQPKNLISIDYQAVSQILFAYPEEFASVGLSEQRAMQQYKNNLLIYTYSYETLERAVMEKRENGIAKFVCNSEGVVLGIHIYGAYAGKLIDIVRLGENLRDFTEEKEKPIAASPSYRETIHELASICKTETDSSRENRKKEKTHWLHFIFTPSLWGTKAHAK